MQHIQGISRHQLQMNSLEDKITADNPVRFIEAFVNHIDAVKLGFQSKVLKTEGRPSFAVEVFLKLYLYGYLNGIRSPEYFVSNFIYNKEQNTYTCPQGQTLTTTGRWHKKTGRTEESGYMFQKYRTPACKTCPVKDQCTSRKGGREIDRSQYADAVEENHQRYKENTQLYRKRQEL